MKLELDWQLLNEPEILTPRHAVVHFYPQLTMLRKILQENLPGERDSRDKRCIVDRSHIHSKRETRSISKLNMLQSQVIRNTVNSSAGRT